MMMGYLEQAARRLVRYWPSSRCRSLLTASLRLPNSFREGKARLDTAVPYLNSATIQLRTGVLQYLALRTE